jgi:hypothetical protein
VALTDENNFESEPMGPKRFTEYSFGAIVVLAAQIGSFLCLTSQVALMVPISWLISLLYSDGELLETLVIGLNLLVIVISIFQVFFGYRLHSHGLEENNKLILFNAVTIIIELCIFILLSISVGLFVLLLIFQVSGGVIIMNITSIYFMSTESVQKEFRRSGKAG